MCLDRHRSYKRDSLLLVYYKLYLYSTSYVFNAALSSLTVVVKLNWNINLNPNLFRTHLLRYVFKFDDNSSQQNRSVNTALDT